MEGDNTAVGPSPTATSRKERNRRSRRRKGEKINSKNSEKARTHPHQNLFTFGSPEVFAGQSFTP